MCILRKKKKKDNIILDEIKSPWVNKREIEENNESFLNRKTLTFNGIDNIIKNDDNLENRIEKLIKYTEYLAEILDESITYSEYLSKQIEILKRKK